MGNWKKSFHVRKVSKWSTIERRSITTKTPQIECRKELGSAAAVITVRQDETLLSLNGPASVSRSDFLEMADVIYEAQVLLRDELNL